MEVYYYLKEKLTGDYRQAYERAEMYAMTKWMSEETVNDRMMHLLDTLITAQQEGTPVEKITGKDFEEFCKAYFQEDNRKTLALETVYSCYRVSWVIFIFEFLELIFQFSEGKQIMNIYSDMSVYLLGFLIGVVIDMIGIFVRPFIFKNKKMNTTGFSFGFLGLFGAMVIGGIFLTNEISLQLPVFPIVLLTGVIIVLYILIRSIYRYRHTGTIRRASNLYKEAEKLAEKQILRQNFADTHIKAYEKKNQKLARKGKMKLSPEQYMEMIYKEKENGAKWGKVVDVFLAVFLIFITISNSYDTAVDAVIFAFLMAGIYVFYLKCSKNFFHIKYMYEVLDECQQNNITVFEYKEWQEKKKIFKDSLTHTEENDDEKE